MDTKVMYLCDVTLHIYGRINRLSGLDNTKVMYLCDSTLHVEGEIFHLVLLGTNVMYLTPCIYVIELTCGRINRLFGPDGHQCHVSM